MMMMVQVESTTTLVHPTWAAIWRKVQSGFWCGQYRYTISDVDYIVYEITASWKDSEVSALLALGKGKAAPKYTVMTAEEARQFIADNADAQL